MKSSRLTVILLSDFSLNLLLVSRYGDALQGSTRTKELGYDLFTSIW